MDPVLISSILTIVLGAISLGIYFGRARVTYRRTLGRKRDLYERLLLLVPDVTHEYFAGKLGLHHAFKNSYEGGYEEFIYPNEFCYVQEIVDKSDRVVLYAVTTQDENFTPVIWPSKVTGQAPSKPGQSIGSVTFEELLEDRVDSVSSFFRAATAPTVYFEAVYGASPGLYRTYLAGFNEWGAAFFDYAEAMPKSLLPQVTLWDRADAQSWICEQEISRWRALAKPNTYGVAASGANLASLGFELHLGPDPVQARLLNE